MSGVEGRAMPDLDHSHDNEYQKLFLMHMDPPVVNSKHSHCCARVLRLDTVETSEAMRKLASVCLLLWMSGLVTARRELSTNASPYTSNSMGTTSTGKCCPWRIWAEGGHHKSE